MVLDCFIVSTTGIAGMALPWEVANVMQLVIVWCMMHGLAPSCMPTSLVGIKWLSPKLTDSWRVAPPLHTLITLWKLDFETSSSTSSILLDSTTRHMFDTNGCVSKLRTV